MYNAIEEHTVIGISNLLRMDKDTVCRKQLIVNGIKTDEIASGNSFKLTQDKYSAHSRKKNGSREYQIQNNPFCTASSNVVCSRYAQFLCHPQLLWPTLCDNNNYTFFQ